MYYIAFFIFGALCMYFAQKAFDLPYGVIHIDLNADSNELYLELYSAIESLKNRKVAKFLIDYKK